MRDLDEKEVIEVSGAGCETVYTCSVSCSGGSCTVKCEVQVRC